MLITRGMQNSYVRGAQYCLHICCFAVSRYDGLLDEGTEIAIRRYQIKYGISVSGNIDDQTWGSMTSVIKAIQTALLKKNYYHGSVNGFASAVLFNNIKQFQAENGLTADGMVGSATRAKLMRSGSSEVSTSDLPLSQGSSGDKVLYLQYGLHIVCCSPNGIDGVFGQGTYTAVTKFQTKYNLDVDGIVGNSTWNKLCALITEIQTALNAADCNVGNVDGIAGPGTYSAVIKFQEENSLTPDGMVGPATRSLLLGSVDDGGTDAFPLSLGSSGPFVLSLQYALYICCCNPNGVDGSFGQGTEAAVKKYQTANSLAVNGIVDLVTWESLKGRIATIQKALVNRGYNTGGTNGIAGALTYNAVISYQTDSGLITDGMVGNATLAHLGISSGNTYGTISSVLSIGSTGSLTNYLQRILRFFGYLDVNVTGIFDDLTKTAVKSFQTSKGLDADGVVGPTTWNTIFSYYHVQAEGAGAEKMANVAAHELSWGFHEDNANNITPYGEWYGMNGEPWCAMFVSWCAKQAGILDGYGVSKVPRFAYCPYGVEWYRTRKKFYRANNDYKVRLGDTVFFWNTTDNAVGHTGIVVAATTTTITSIEGNASDGVKKRTYDKGNTYVYGFGCNDGPELVNTYIPPDETDKDAKRWDTVEKCLDSLDFQIPDSLPLSYNEELELVNLESLKVTLAVSPTYNYCEHNPGVYFSVSGGAIEDGIIASVHNFSASISHYTDVEQGLFELLSTIGYGGLALSIGSGYDEIRRKPFVSVLLSCKIDECPVDENTTIEVNFELKVVAYLDHQDMLAEEQVDQINEFLRKLELIGETGYAILAVAWSTIYAFGHEIKEAFANMSNDDIIAIILFSFIVVCLLGGFAVFA